MAEPTNEHRDERRPGGGASRRAVVTLGGTAAAAGVATVAASGGTAWASPAIRTVSGAPAAAASPRTGAALRLFFDGENRLTPNPAGVTATVPARIVLENTSSDTSIPAGTGIGVKSFPFTTADWAASRAGSTAPGVDGPATVEGEAHWRDETGYPGTFFTIAPLPAGGRLVIPLVTAMTTGDTRDRWLSDTRSATATVFNPPPGTPAADFVAEGSARFATTAAPAFDLGVILEGEAAGGLLADGSQYSAPRTLVLRSGVRYPDAGPVPIRGISVTPRTVIGVPRLNGTPAPGAVRVEQSISEHLRFERWVMMTNELPAGSTLEVPLFVQCAEAPGETETDLFEASMIEDWNFGEVDPAVARFQPVPLSTDPRPAPLALRWDATERNGAGKPVWFELRNDGERELPPGIAVASYTSGYAFSARAYGPFLLDGAAIPEAEVWHYRQFVDPLEHDWPVVMVPIPTGSTLRVGVDWGDLFGDPGTTEGVIAVAGYTEGLRRTAQFEFQVPE